MSSDRGVSVGAPAAGSDRDKAEFFASLHKESARPIRNDELMAFAPGVAAVESKKAKSGHSNHFNRKFVTRWLHKMMFAAELAPVLYAFKRGRRTFTRQPAELHWPK
jgi:hypothetical protein